MEAKSIYKLKKGNAGELILIKDDAEQVCPKQPAMIVPDPSSLKQYRIERFLCNSSCPFFKLAKNTEANKDAIGIDCMYPKTLFIDIESVEEKTMPKPYLKLD